MLQRIISFVNWLFPPVTGSSDWTEEEVEELEKRGGVW